MKKQISKQQTKERSKRAYVAPAFEVIDIKTDQSILLNASAENIGGGGHW